jgi:hypothetical protein
MIEREQYLLDLGRLAGAPEQTLDEARSDEVSSPLGLHDTTLFDEGASAAGALYDEADGREYREQDNSDVYDGLSVFEEPRSIRLPYFDDVLVAVHRDGGLTDEELDEALDPDVLAELEAEAAEDTFLDY